MTGIPKRSRGGYRKPAGRSEEMVSDHSVEEQSVETRTTETTKIQAWPRAEEEGRTRRTLGSGLWTGGRSRREMSE
ncbi:hypothetical protein BDP81DRAFT_412984 [Colletotrichum phormii]|uniref:Uncharacterized protein n=1 Tax=Colletotrichum phormii TaxID=359342 RepID=A0AAJ0A348_9PEZI|nr:uncharacterized protein BDP81DRAFT_412984 [Colletotrichum phormii]KAK1655599.1 hypothetical protein BDP81DRAFT_412984 [Colletotrichum phormii]